MAGSGAARPVERSGSPESSIRATRPQCARRTMNRGARTAVRSPPDRRLGRLLLELIELRVGLIRCGLRHQRRLDRALDGVLGHYALAHVASGRQLELDIEERLL